MTVINRNMFTEVSQIDSSCLLLNKISSHIVNRSIDKRLRKVRKKAHEVNISPGEDSIEPLLDPVNLSKTCIVLRAGVTELTGIVWTLTNEVRILQEKVSDLEWQLKSTVNRSPHKIKYLFILHHYMTLEQLRKLILKVNFFKCFVANYHASVAIINYLNKYTCENGICNLGDLYYLENDLET